MSALYITIDTEYAAGMVAKRGPDCRAENFARSIACATPGGAVGTEYQMDVFDRRGLKAVFFVDPMPALLWGVEAIADVVGPIAARGHDVQLHLHTEWLEFAEKSPVGGRTGLNIKDFAFEEQCRLLEYARRVLIAAGAPAPTAFRAGNYGANDDTLRALAEIGLTHDTSHCPGIAGSHCEIGLTTEDRQPVKHCGVVEVPIGCIASTGGSLRHTQLTALSAQEILSALAHAQANRIPSLTLVSHSFEMLSRDRSRINQIVRRRFERLCAGLERAGVPTATYAGNPPVALATAFAPVLPHSALRTGFRLAEQALANQLYGAR